jgi:hypothetical protein
MIKGGKGSPSTESTLSSLTYPGVPVLLPEIKTLRTCGNVGEMVGRRAENLWESSVAVGIVKTPD